jgi:hypothetical protein
MLKASQQDIWPFSQSGETFVQRVADFCFRAEDGVFHAPLDVPMAVLFWVEFWCIRWQVLDMNSWKLLQKRLHDFGPVGTRLIPDQNDGTLNMTQQVFQSDQYLLGIDRAVKVPFVDLARNRQADHCRCFPTEPGNSFQLRRLALRCPREPHRLCIGEPKFVFKYDLCAEPPRLFLSAANPGSAKPGSGLHPVPSLWFRASAHSSPDHPISD